MPAGYLDRPELNPNYIFTWEAFFILATDRPSGFGEGSIPFAAIERFAERYGVADDLDEFDRFQAIIRAVDHEYLKIRGEQAKATADNKQDTKERPVS